jgi:hypothetical protein
MAVGTADGPDPGAETRAYVEELLLAVPLARGAEDAVAYANAPVRAVRWLRSP